MAWQALNLWPYTASRAMTAALSFSTVPQSSSYLQASHLLWRSYPAKEDTKTTPPNRICVNTTFRLAQNQPRGCGSWNAWPIITDATAALCI